MEGEERRVEERGGGAMTCPSTCPIIITCQKKYNPPAGCRNRKTVLYRNGYAVMARQEYAMREGAIDFGGDFQ